MRTYEFDELRGLRHGEVDAEKAEVNGERGDELRRHIAQELRAPGFRPGTSPTR